MRTWHNKEKISIHYSSLWVDMIGGVKLIPMNEKPKKWGQTSSRIFKIEKRNMYSSNQYTFPVNFANKNTYLFHKLHKYSRTTWKISRQDNQYKISICLHPRLKWKQLIHAEYALGLDLENEKSQNWLMFCPKRF